MLELQENSCMRWFYETYISLICEFYMHEIHMSLRYKSQGHGITKNNKWYGTTKNNEVD